LKVFHAFGFNFTFVTGSTQYWAQQGCQYL
jgi:hypothetical protein